MAPVQPKNYPDSAEFAKAFKEYYAVNKPEKTLKQQAEQYFHSLSRGFAMQGIDSTEAAKVAFKNLDDKALEKIYFDTYRRNLTAKELKKFAEFIKTPEGKHIADVWQNLQRVTTESSMYIARTINLNLTPIRQASHEKMEKERPPQKRKTESQDKLPKSSTPATIDVFDQKNAASKDSMMRRQSLERGLPRSIDSLATPPPSKQ